MLLRGCAVALLRRCVLCVGDGRLMLLVDCCFGAVRCCLLRVVVCRLLPGVAVWR